MALNYGNKLKTILKIAVVSSVLGILTVLAAVVGITLEGRWAQANLWVLPMLFCVPFIMVPVIAVTACFSVRVTDRMVQSVFLGRFVLKQYLIEDFERLDVYPHSLIFRGGRKIRESFGGVRSHPTIVAPAETKSSTGSDINPEEAKPDVC